MSGNFTKWLFLATVSQVELEFVILVFAVGGKHRTQENSLRARMRTDDKLNIHVTMVTELNPDHNGGR